MILWMTKLHIILYICVSNMFSMQDICAQNVPIYEWTNFEQFPVLNRRMLFLWWFLFTHCLQIQIKYPHKINPPCLICVITTLLCCQQHYFVIIIDHMILSTYTTSCHSLKEKNTIFFSNALHPHLSHPYAHNHSPQCIVSK
jgi:hypothetical protein